MILVSTLQVDGLARIHSDASSATETAFPHALYDVLVLDGGRVVPGSFSLCDGQSTTFLFGHFPGES